MISFKISESSLNKLREQIKESWESEVLAKLIKVCDKAIENQWAKFRPDGYDDQTGQLRSSTGYILYYNGKVMHDRFELANYGSDKAPGLKTGRDLAFAKLRESKGWGILFVAGMEYASYVQGKNFSVLSDAELILSEDLYRELNSIKFS